MKEDFANLFSEPDIEDVSIIKDETFMDWLRLNTSQKAKDSRAFLIRHISELPEDWREQLKHDLKHRWSSAFFELICGRLLQMLGATIEVEAEKETKDNQICQKKPDFKTTFSNNNSIIVEATTTILDPESRITSKNQNDLIEIIKNQIPGGWSFLSWSLPEIGQGDSKKEFQKAIGEIFSDLPTGENKSSIYFTKAISQGTICLELIPMEMNNSFLAGPVNPSADDAQKRIEKAIHNKRKQTRNSTLPVILAINTDGLGCTYEDFDQVLFGEEIGYFSSFTNTITHSRFNPNGLFTGRANKEKPPTYAGVIAFFNVGLPGWQSEPILYLHPHFEGKLPEELLKLNLRFYDSEKNELGFRKGINLTEKFEFVGTILSTLFN